MNRIGALRNMAYAYLNSHATGVAISKVMIIANGIIKGIGDFFLLIVIYNPIKSKYVLIAGDQIL